LSDENYGIMLVQQILNSTIACFGLCKAIEFWYQWFRSMDVFLMCCKNRKIWSLHLATMCYHLD